MSRSFMKSVPPRPSGVEPHPHSIARVYKLQLITPLFGGGVEAGVNDPITLIRPSSIRGHLRFWWRATRGEEYETAEALRAREGEIWGTTDNPSSVQIEVRVTARSEPEPCAQYTWNAERRRHELHWNAPFDTGVSLPYALFPFQGKTGENAKDPAGCVRRADFDLAVRWLRIDRLQELREIENRRRIRLDLKPLPPTIKDIGLDVEAAVWAWVNFGGIGARTRRGCGALCCVPALPSESDIYPRSAERYGEWLIERMRYYGISRPSTPRPWPTFFRTVCLKESNQDALGCWKGAIQLLKDFRQGVSIPGVDLGRDKGEMPRRPGRSRWPEPEAIRELVLTQRDLAARPAKWHPKDLRMPGSYFPRAELGMPIIFEIRDEVVPGAPTRKGGPPNIKPTLQFDENSDRMASSIILRPVRFSDGRCAALMAVLTTEPLQSAWLEKGDFDLTSGLVVTIRDATLASYPDSPLSRRTPGSPGSALEAFESFAVEPNQKYMRVFP